MNYRLAIIDHNAACVANPVYASKEQANQNRARIMEGYAEDFIELEADVNGRMYTISYGTVSAGIVIVIEEVSEEESQING